MCGSMVDIQSATAENRRENKKRKKKPQGKNIMSASATQGAAIIKDIMFLAVTLVGWIGGDIVYGR